ncbi:hypothetical protein HII31_00425, partial [Pseudocercospora fuligena]
MYQELGKDKENVSRNRRRTQDHWVCLSHSNFTLQELNNPSGPGSRKLRFSEQNSAVQDYDAITECYRCDKLARVNMLWFLRSFVALAVIDLVRASNDDVLSLTPSRQWQGNDGKWSTFEIKIGSPVQNKQTVHLLPSTSAHGGSATFVILPQGCQNLTSCASSRGNSFPSNESTTWSLERLRNGGFYQMDLPAESQLGLANNAHYGFDTISLPSPGSVAIQSQLIGGLSTQEHFWLGSLGISPINFNCSDPSREVPNLLRTLKDEGHIGSLSWGYTAGSFPSNSFGSLTLGGYDTSRFDSNTTVTFPFSGNVSRDLILSPAGVDMRYFFPLKRANSSTKYTLGRAFLQAAYLSADYERKEFNLSQARFEAGVEEQIFAIRALDHTAGNTEGRSGLRTRDYVGVACGFGWDGGFVDKEKEETETPECDMGS